MGPLLVAKTSKPPSNLFRNRGGSLMRVWEQEGRSPRVTPPSHHLKSLSRERLGRAKEGGGGVGGLWSWIVQGRVGFGGGGGV